MTIAEIKALNDAHCGKTDAYSSTLGLLNLNNAVYRVETRYMMSAGDWKFDDSNNTDFPIATTNIIASQQDYTLPTETIRIDRIEVSYDGVNWYRAIPFNPTEDSNALTTANIAGEFSKSAPSYRLLGRSIFLYPIPDANVTAGLKVYGQRLHTAYTSSDYSTATKTMGMDLNWQEQIAREMSLNYLLDNDMSRYNIMFQTIESQYIILDKFNGSKNQDEKQSLEPAYENMN